MNLALERVEAFGDRRLVDAGYIEFQHADAGTDVVDISPDGGDVFCHLAVGIGNDRLFELEHGEKGACHAADPRHEINCRRGWRRSSPVSSGSLLSGIARTAGARLLQAELRDEAAAARIVVGDALDAVRPVDPGLAPVRMQRPSGMAAVSP